MSHVESRLPLRSPMSASFSWRRAHLHGESITGRAATQVAFTIFVLTETQCVPTGSPLASVRCRKG